MQIVKKEELKSNDKFKDWNFSLVEELEEVPIIELSGSVISVKPTYPAVLSHYLKKEYKKIIDIWLSRKEGVPPEEAMSENIDTLIEFIYRFLGFKYLMEEKQIVNIDLTRPDKFKANEKEWITAAGITKEALYACEHSQLFNAFAKIIDLKDPIKNLSEADKKRVGDRVPFLAIANDPVIIARVMQAISALENQGKMLNHYLEQTAWVREIVTKLKPIYEKMTGETLDIESFIPGGNMDTEEQTKSV